VVPSGTRLARPSVCSSRETGREVRTVQQRIAIISDHASPLAAVGGIDSGGQNIYVGETARSLAARGYLVDVFTRKDQPELPEVVDWLPGVRVIHVPAGPAAFVRKEDVLPLLPEFAAFVQGFAATQRYDVVHAHFFMSGAVALQLKASLGIPFVVTFHGLGLVRRLHQGAEPHRYRTRRDPRRRRRRRRVSRRSPQSRDALRRRAE
jgi:D-inositol-3-phosphate glycosyltransferase